MENYNGKRGRSVELRRVECARVESLWDETANWDINWTWDLNGFAFISHNALEIMIIKQTQKVSLVFAQVISFHYSRPPHAINESTTGPRYLFNLLALLRRLIAPPSMEAFMVPFDYQFGAIFASVSALVSRVQMENKQNIEPKADSARKVNSSRSDNGWGIFRHVIHAVWPDLI